jgi:hypothetical protein
MHTLARVGLGERSARELRVLLPPLPVASGEAKVRAVLRAHPACFLQVYAGRWQVGRLPSLSGGFLVNGFLVNGRNRPTSEILA